MVVGLGLLWYFWPASVNERVLMNDNEVTGSEVTFTNVPEESVATMSTGTYRAEVEESSIDWSAGKPAIAGYTHTGTFSLQSGEVDLTDGALSGEFTVDINSLQMTSLGGGKAGQESVLEGHLKGERFFDAATYGTATFTITDIEPKVLPGPGQQDYTASGTLTLKGRTEEISFPIKVIVGESDEVWMTAAFDLDRTKWGISFGSASIAEEITENIIGDTVKMELQVKLVKN